MSDEDFSHLEAELKRLRPRSPSAGLWQRLDNELAAGVAPRNVARPYRTATSWRSWKWAVWGAAAAAVIAIFSFAHEKWGRPVQNGLTGAQLTASHAEARPGVSPDLYRPVSADQVLFGLPSVERVTLPDGTPARRIHEHYVDTITWKNPHTNASLQWTVPREEIRVIPITFQ